MTLATYNPDNTLTEKCEMQKPRPPNGGVFSPYWDIHLKRMAAYNKHVAGLRTIPCSPSCRGLWKAGQEIEEGKDYEVRKCSDPGNCLLEAACVTCKSMAFPLSVKSEDGWMTTKPTFTEECILITASKVRDKWNYNFWLIEKLDDMENKWYWGILCPDGEEWGDLADLEADKYLVIPKLKP